MKIKKILATVMAIATIFTSGVTASAAEPEQPQITGHIVSEVAEKYNITEDEVINLNANFKNALKTANEVDAISENDSSVKTVPVSENLVLTITTEETPSITKAVYERTITSTLELQNILGGTVVTLNSIGVFRTNGSTSVPVDAYGTYSSLVWNVATTESKLGSTAYNAWVRNGFSGEFNIGIDPVSMTIQSFSYSCKIYCNAAGKYSATWS